MSSLLLAVFCLPQLIVTSVGGSTLQLSTVTFAGGLLLSPVIAPFAGGLIDAGKTTTYEGYICMTNIARPIFFKAYPY